MRIVDSENIKRRTRDFQKHKKKYIVQKLNQIWSMNEYLKLKSFDIEIYKNIDVYSKYVSWIYINMSICTKINVYCQYLNIVKNINLMLVIIRSNRKTKIFLMIQTHFEFKCKKSNIRTNFTTKKQQNMFKKCYYYKINTFNQRIKTW